ncbi:endolytic transglycosylase MltG [Streptomyces sp. NPDC052114]|uniref:endolytic transglycosylase MltG n=1 Tax=unclassified Streptomyces TaxID=2593676 RepID=UPI0034490DAC
MTEYGRGPGSEPWHPEDPLYGDSGWGGQSPAGGPSTYGGQGQYHPQQPHQHQNQHQPPHQAQYGGDWSTGQQQGYGQQYDTGQHQYDTGQHQYHADPAQAYNGGPGQGYGNGPDQGYDGGSGQGYDGGPGQGYNGGPDSYNASWDTGGQGQVPYGGDPMDPYGGQQNGYGAEAADYYATPDAYAPPEPPGRRRSPEPEPAAEPDWDPGPDQGEHAFFAGGADDDAYDDDDEPGRRGGRGDRRGGRGGKKPKKRRSGCACLVVTLVFAGGLGGVGYFGYQFYQDRFGTAPDYAGEGTGQATVEIPKDSSGYAIGQKLKDAGVVKSVDAFVSAQGQNPQGKTIQAGVYVLKKEMSAKSAVALMLNPKSRSNLIIPEGRRNAWVYEQIDTRLELDKGTTAKVAKKEWKSLGLPSWANTNKDIKDPLEGFLYPSSYPVAKGQKPEDVLKRMIAQANEKYDEFGLKSKADELNLKDPLQVLTVASLVQAEGMTHDDFKKMAAVVYNRLKATNTATNQKLEFDSAYNYLKGQSKIKIPISEIRNDPDPYNTYYHKGLPPGPIGNPGDDALKATLEPDGGGWIYFVSVDGKKTEFTKTLADHNKLVDKLNERQNNGE